MTQRLICSAVTKTGKECKNKAKEGGMCGRHTPTPTPLKDLEPTQECITITFGDVAENHVRMQKIGTLAKEGLSCQELKAAQTKFEAKGVKCEYIDLNTVLKKQKAEPAAVLIVRSGIKLFADLDEAWKEQHTFRWDTKALMYGKVRNKKARYNVCFDEEAQKPDYSVGKGTVVAFKDMPCLNKIRSLLPEYVGAKTKNLKAEGNLYYDTNKCYIGWHGDSERKIVVAFRFGALPLYYQWYLQGKTISDKIELKLATEGSGRFAGESGDCYIMSQKATGNDWKQRKMPTLRHSAGHAKVLKM